MLRVGDFSKLAHVTVKTLRYYDELGLLRPIWTDRFTGYRYYSLDQLPRLNRILALKDLGFSLEQVGKLLDGRLSAPELRQLFDQKQRELADLVRSDQERLIRVSERIREIEMEGRLPLQDVTIKSIPAMAAASLREIIPSLSGLAASSSRMRGELELWAARQGVSSRGAWLTLYHHKDYREEKLDVEIVLAYDLEALAAIREHSSSIEVKPLPAVESMACLLQPANIEALQNSYTTLFTWSDRHGYLRLSPLRELALHDPMQKGGKTQFIEVQMPVQSRASLQQKFLNNPYRKEKEMEPQWIDLPEMKVVGVAYIGKNENQEIPQTWDVFNRRCQEIKHVAPGSPAYGVCACVPEAAQGEFEYVACYGVDQASEIPAGMVERTIPAGRYAVFVHIGPLDGLRATYEYIYQYWLPQSGFQLTGGPDFELYNQEFVNGAADSRFYIYVPIK